jgi:protein involved in polysaccharide export with SLBB domain
MKVPHCCKALLSLSLLVLLTPASLTAQEAPGSEVGAMLPGGSGSYVISPLDYLRVALYVADELQFESQVRVSQEGSISVPHLGKVDVAGLSLEETREQLYEPYNRDFYVEPHIDVSVLSYSERSVTVIGKVNRQGQIPFPSEEGMTLLEAIALAGGWSNDRLSDKRNVTITRTEANGERVSIEIDARNISTKDYPLKEGDLINVPERLW